jgi:2'-5' RNA ligase superfamily
MASAASVLTPKSTVALIPPPHLWPEIQAIRAVHDRGYYRWPPHVNMLYPFLEDKGSNFDDAEVLLKTMISSSSLKPFWVTLSHLGHFIHNGKSATIWLHPTPAASADGGHSNPVVDLQSFLVSAFPQCDELTKRSSMGFRPHLSLGQWGATGIDGAKAKLQAQWDGTGCARAAAAAGAGVPAAASKLWLVDRICIMSRAGFEAPFTIRKEIPLVPGADLSPAWLPLAPCIPHPPPLSSLVVAGKKQTGLPKGKAAAAAAAAPSPTASTAFPSPAIPPFSVPLAPADLVFPPPDPALLLPD